MFADWRVEREADRRVGAAVRHFCRAVVDRINERYGLTIAIQNDEESR